MTRPGRPPFPRPAKGDALILRGGRGSGAAAIDVRVVAVGPTYVHVVPANRFADFDPGAHAWLVRKFLLTDQREGALGTRVGYAASVATAEQHAYDDLVNTAAEYLRDQGITVEFSSPWWNRKVELAEVLKRAVDA